MNKYTVLNDVKLNFDEKGLIPAVVQDSNTKDVLMVAYMNREALEKTISTKKAWFYSRKRQKLWQKGETSGNFLIVNQILYDCDEDTLLLKVEPKGPACHTGNDSCFYRKLFSSNNQEDKSSIDGQNIDIIYELIDVIDSRFKEAPEGSYVAKLYKGGRERILKKVGEEAAEVIIASMSQKKSDTIYEIVDLIFHLLISMRYDKISMEEIMIELKRRRK